jgi:hypothetical protein
MVSSKKFPPVLHPAFARSFRGNLDCLQSYSSSSPLITPVSSWRSFAHNKDAFRLLCASDDDNTRSGNSRYPSSLLRRPDSLQNFPHPYEFGYSSSVLILDVKMNRYF